jgi:hypothetical protein
MVVMHVNVLDFISSPFWFDSEVARPIAGLALISPHLLRPCLVAATFSRPRRKTRMLKCGTR